MLKGKHDCFVSASELARLGYCERQVAFDATFGEQETDLQRQARDRGNRAHAEFFDKGERLARRSATRGKCFVATLVLGASAETQALRAFRDLYLRRFVLGRWLIGRYYRVSPLVCRWLARNPTVFVVVKSPIRIAAQLAALAVRSKWSL